MLHLSTLLRLFQYYDVVRVLTPLLVSRSRTRPENRLKVCRLQSGGRYFTRCDGTGGDKHFQKNFGIQQKSSLPGPMDSWRHGLHLVSRLQLQDVRDLITVM
jgi:hypothetical protein